MSAGTETLAQPAIRRLRAYDPGHDLVALRERHAQCGLLELGGNESLWGPSPTVAAAVVAELPYLHRYPDPLGVRLKRALSRRYEHPVGGIVLGNGSHELLMQFAQVFAGPDAGVTVSQYGFAVYAIAAAAVGAPVSIAPALPPEADVPPGALSGTSKRERPWPRSGLQTHPIAAMAAPTEGLKRDPREDIVGAAMAAMPLPTSPNTFPMPMGHDPEAMLAAVGPGTRLVCLANPNNPTGTWWSAATVEDFLSRLPEHIVCVIDEAYAEFVTDPAWTSAVTLLPEFPRLLVTRTFSKIHALAALRVGYALGHPDLIALIERLRESFNVNQPGLAAAEAALADNAHVERVRAANARERERLAAGLRARGLWVGPSQGNFLLVRFGPDTAFIDAGLLERGVVVRPMTGYGLPEHLRISVGRPEDNSRLLAALDATLAGEATP